MAQSLEEWIASDVRVLDDRSPAWLAQHHFFRDPYRPRFVDQSYFFSPADGIILYQKIVKPDSQLVDFKSERYTLQDAMRDSSFHSESLVIGIFMTFFDVHTNRIPYSGYLAYRELEPIGTYNRPMVAMENTILEDLRIDLNKAAYLRQNQRMVNRIYAPRLRQSYYVLQIADYDVDCILPYRLNQNTPFRQGDRFSQIRHGSQVELVIPLTYRYGLEVLQPDGCHVQAGLDPLVRIDVQHFPGIDLRKGEV
ncbi:MAG: phosphatidylserine decarboxylase [Actinomycetota bacterium]|nr:phosphatidylserine decarboxylase [Actinomycetota bacterium]